MSLHSFRQGELVDKPSALVLAKFSYATTSTERGAPVNWTHLAGDTNMFVVFERVRVGSTLQNAHERRILKVQRGSDVLEELDLNSLVDEAAERARQLRPPDQSPSIAVIVKSPCLAVRYPTRNNQVRRFQLKFSLDADYYKALAILSELGCPITQSTSGSQQQHRIARSISSSSLIPPSPSTSAISNYVDRASPLLSVGGQSNPVQSPIDLSYQVSRTVSQGRGLIGEEPTTRRSHGVDSYDTRASMVSSASSATACDLGPGLNYSSTQHQAQASVHSTQSNTQAASSMDFGPPLRGAESQHLQVPHSSIASPISSAIHSPESLSQVLPPKRELPFLKPEAKKPRKSVEKTPRKSHAPPSATLSPSRSIISGSEACGLVNSQQGVTPLLNESQGVNAMQAPRVAENKSSHPLSPSKNSQLNKRPPLNAPATVGPPSPNKGTQSAAHTMDPPADRNPPPTPARSTVPSNPTIPPESNSERAAPITTSDLTSYLQTPTPERSALIESWVCQQLQDDGFLKLCEDVEGVWRRIAFGR